MQSSILYTIIIHYIYTRLCSVWKPKSWINISFIPNFFFSYDVHLYVFFSCIFSVVKRSNLICLNCVALASLSAKQILRFHHSNEHYGCLVLKYCITTLNGVALEPFWGEGGGFNIKTMDYIHFNIKPPVSAVF